MSTPTPQLQRSSSSSSLSSSRWFNLGIALIVAIPLGGLLYSYYTYRQTYNHRHKHQNQNSSNQSGNSNTRTNANILRGKDGVTVLEEDYEDISMIISSLDTMNDAQHVDEIEELAIRKSITESDVPITKRSLSLQLYYCLWLYYISTYHATSQGSSGGWGKSELSEEQSHDLTEAITILKQANISTNADQRAIDVVAIQILRILEPKSDEMLAIFERMLQQTNKSDEEVLVLHACAQLLNRTEDLQKVTLELQQLSLGSEEEAPRQRRRNHARQSRNAAYGKGGESKKKGTAKKYIKNKRF
jgi:hypothetical protein